MRIIDTYALTERGGTDLPEKCGWADRSSNGGPRHADQFGGDEAHDATHSKATRLHCGFIDCLL